MEVQILSRAHTIYKNMKHLDPKAIWLFFIGSVIGWTIIMFFLSFWIAGVTIAALQIGKAYISLGLFLTLLMIFLACFYAFLYFWAQLSYKNYKYQLRPEGFYKEYGVIWKKYVTIPYSRIQNVDIYRGLVARLLGLSDLHIQTAGMSFTGKRGSRAEGRLPGLSIKDANMIRDELIKRSQKSNAQGL